MGSRTELIPECPFSGREPKSAIGAMGTGISAHSSGLIGFETLPIGWLAKSLTEAIGEGAQLG